MVVVNHAQRWRNFGLGCVARVRARDEVVYDWPDGHDLTCARVVTLWRASSLLRVSHYDRDADIVWLELAGFDGRQVRVEERDWGLVETHSETGAVVAIEFWKASRVLPSEALDVLPAPAAQPTVIETEHAGSEASFGPSAGRLGSHR